MHSKLAVQFWDEAEGLRPDCRFVYITHDLNFALSRRGATVLVARSSNAIEAISTDNLPSAVAAEVLGAATLPFYARRIFVFEGESGKGFASEFFAAWFDGDETFSVPAGDRESVAATVTGLKKVGVVGAEVIGLVDRDFYSDDALAAPAKGVTVLPLHEVESVLCDENIIAALADHLGKDPKFVLSEFLAKVRKEYRGQTLSVLIARRVRSRIGDLLEGAFTSAQIVADLSETTVNHSTGLAALDLPRRSALIFSEETTRVTNALSSGGAQLLEIVPGKHLLAILSSLLGFSGTSELTDMVVRSLRRNTLIPPSESLRRLGEEIEAALVRYLPSRRP